MNERRGLGRGLSALIPSGEAGQTGLREIPVSGIAPNPRQPRGGFDEDELAELAASIREVGLLQPILVREVGPERYELVSGERRLRAAKLSGMTRIPAIVRATSDQDMLREAVIENIHRSQLNPLEEAAAYQQLLEDFNVTHEELARRLGRSRPSLTNSLRLLSLPPSVQRKVAAGVLSAGHAKAILSLEQRGDQERVAERIVAEGLSVRATEELVRVRYHDGEPEPTAGGAPHAATEPRRVNPPGVEELEGRLSAALMTRVRITMGKRKGRITIDVPSVDALQMIVSTIAHGLQQPSAVASEPTTST